MEPKQSGGDDPLNILRNMGIPYVPDLTNLGSLLGGGGGIPNLSTLNSLLGGSGGGSNAQQNSSGGIWQGNLSNLGSVLGVLPQAKKKSILMDMVAPIVKVMSPKWGDIIVEILKNMDLEKLLLITQSEKELEKHVREEENRHF